MTHRPTSHALGVPRTRGKDVSATTRRALRAAARAARGPALTPTHLTAIVAVGSLFLVPAALALFAPHVLEGLVAMARHGSEPWLAWGALALLAGLPLTLAGLPWTPRAHAEIDATVAALARAVLPGPAPHPHPSPANAPHPWPAADAVTRRAA